MCRYAINHQNIVPSNIPSTVMMNATMNRSHGVHGPASFGSIGLFFVIALVPHYVFHSLGQGRIIQYIIYINEVIIGNIP